METVGQRRAPLRRWSVLIGVVAVMVAMPTAAADEADEPQAPDPVVTAPDSGNDEGAGLLFDERLAIVADRVPEFTSLYVDDDGRTLFVRVTERRPRIIADLRHALREAFPGEELPSRIRLLDAEFSFEQLHRWHERALELFGSMQGEVVMLDVDDRTGLMRIGVSTAAAGPELEQHLAGMDIPPAGWVMEEMDPVDVSTSVTDRHRPTVGGLQIQTGSANGGTCTYGLTAIRNGVIGFITNSHCTNTQGGVESTRFAQPFFDAEGANAIATETVDPNYFTGGSCPANMRCRFSDSAFARRTAGTSSRAIVENPLNSLAWNGTDRYFVVNERSPFVGLALRKVGRTTGHTVGQVEQTCVDFGVNGTNIVLLCQSETTHDTIPGDSGSPVFRTTGCTVNGVSDVCANTYGLVWGTGGAFSPIANIQRSGELGPLDLCATNDC